MYEYEYFKIISLPSTLDVIIFKGVENHYEKFPSS